MNDELNLLDEAGKAAFDKVCKIEIDIENQYQLYINETEKKLLRVFRDFKYTKEQLVILLVDEKEIYRKVAKIYLEELNNEQI